MSELSFSQARKRRNDKDKMYRDSVLATEQVERLKRSSIQKRADYDSVVEE